MLFDSDEEPCTGARTAQRARRRGRPRHVVDADPLAATVRFAINLAMLSAALVAVVAIVLVFLVLRRMFPQTRSSFMAGDGALPRNLTMPMPDSVVKRHRGDLVEGNRRR